MDNVKRSDFSVDLRYGQAGEILVNSLLTAPIESVEVKRDRRWKDTGNIFIEVWCWSDNKNEWYPSGLQTSPAKHWTLVLEELTLTVPIDQLKQTVKTYGRVTECLIPPNYTKGYLIKETDIFKIARSGNRT
jgi:hypothetical protein